MNEEMKHATAESEQADLDLTSILRRIQQQLAFLEKKVDLLIKQSSERSGGRDRHFSKPPFRQSGFGRSYQGPSRGDRRERPSGSRGGFSESNSFGKQESSSHQNAPLRDFGRGRKAFFRRRKEKN